MRKIDLPPIPAQLTKDVQTRLTETFLKDPDKNVWNQPYIKEALLRMTEYKCVYSEFILQENSCYMEIEHFYPKSLYPEKVVEWGNMLPVCKVCNSKKGDIDSNKVALINPLIDEPSEHITFHHFQCSPLDEKGKNSIIYYDLNNLQQFQKPRFTQIQKNEEELERLAVEIEEGITDSAQVRLTNRLKVILQTGQKTEPYSVCISLAITNDKHYREIKAYLKRKEAWNRGLETLDEGLTCNKAYKTGEEKE